MGDKRDDLDDLLASARDGEAPTDALIARVLADAATVQEDLQAPAPAPASRRGWGAWLSGIGGWRGAGGLVAATATGLMVGVYAPDSVDALLDGALTDYGVIASDELVYGWGALLDLEDG